MHNLKRLTRDDTEHGNDYYLAAEVDKMLTAQQSAPVKSLECAHCHITIEALNQKAMHLIDENQRLRAELKYNIAPEAQPAAWIGLTNDERDSIINNSMSPACVVIATEAKLREKNGGAK